MAGDAGPQDGGDVGVRGVVGEQDWADGVDDDDSVVAERGDVHDQVVAALPQGQVVAVALVAVDDDVSLPSVGVDEDDRGRGAHGERLDLTVGEVVGDGLEHSTIADEFVLNGRLRSDKIGEVGAPGTPAHGQGTVVTATVGTSVRSIRIVTSVVPEYCGQLLVACQG